MTLAKENLPPGVEVTHVEMTGAEGVWVRERGNIDRLFSLTDNETVKTLAKNTVGSDCSLGSLDMKCAHCLHSELPLWVSLVSRRLVMGGLHPSASQVNFKLHVERDMKPNQD